MTGHYPHDFFDDMESRISPENHRNPRVVVVDECEDGNLAFGELGDDGVVGDTTLIGAVLSKIEVAIRKHQKLAGVVIADGIVYAFVLNRRKGQVEVSQC